MKALRSTLAALVLLGCWPSLAAAVITDDFNRASLDANWEAAGGTIWAISSSIVVKPVSQYTHTAIRRSEATFPNDQYAEVKTEKKTGAGDDSFQMGPICRADSSGNGYFVWFDTTEVYLVKRVAGTNTTLNNFTQTIAADTMTTLRVSATGTTIKAFVNGVERISVTDSALTTGKPGCRALTGQTSLFPRFDDFESTDAVSAGGVVPLIQLMQLIH